MNHTLRLLAFVVCASSTVVSAQTATDAKPPAKDIWPEREATIAVDAKTPRIRIGIWDSGVDTTLFPSRIARDKSGKLMVRGYDAFKKRQDTPMEDMPADLLARQDELNALTMALDDLDTKVDSPGARDLMKRQLTISAKERDAIYDDVDRWGGYIHGSAVADAALTTHPRAELVIARMEWWHGNPPVPCWSREMANREADSIHDLLNFLVESGARVVNMSWGRYERSYQKNLEQCAKELPLEERNAIARYSVDTIRAVLRAGMMAAPRVLFVGAAGNEGKTITQSNPATRLDLPNFMLIGAVDRSGTKASFSNAGPEVALYANGWRIPGRLPGGVMAYGTGTSLAAPLVSNTAAKMLAVNSQLTGADLRRLLQQTADTNSAGLRLMHSAKAVESARASLGGR
ncbi:MAG: S8 family serine peptidase [Gemmatimonadaceae bacterium]